MEGSVPQVAPEHYRNPRYLDRDRWVSYGNQVRAVLERAPQSVLEIGIGNGIVRDALRNLGFRVTTLDIDPKLSPDLVGDVSDLSNFEESFDFVLCAEVLEHLPYDRLMPSLTGIRKIAKRWAFITLPHAGMVFHFEEKLPLLPRIVLFFKVPLFWRRHLFNGEHYWELGKRGYSRKSVRALAEAAGFRIVQDGIDPYDPAHYWMLLETK